MLKEQIGRKQSWTSWEMHTAEEGGISIKICADTGTGTGNGKRML